MTTAVQDERDVGPQPGPQTMALASPADILVYGGQAGGGKTIGLLLEAIRHRAVPGFGAVIFRRTRPMITAEGSMWDQSFELYGGMGTPRESTLEWTFDCSRCEAEPGVLGPPGESSVKFSHMEHEKNRLDWAGAQIAMLGYDQLETFTARQFFFMLSRNRTTLRDHRGRPIRPYVRATANPDADSWLAEFIAWWWDPDTGYAIPERAGVVRYLLRVNDELHWGPDPASLLARFPEIDPDRFPPKSVTFIPSSIYDNPILLRNDPGYLSNLMSLPTVERERLLHGNWKVKSVAGGMFPLGCFEIVPAAPARAVRIRYWDAAATPGAGDWSAGVRLAWADGTFYVEHVVRDRWGTKERDDAILQTAETDARLYDLDGSTNSVTQIHQTEPGASGKDSARAFVRLLNRFTARVDPVPTGSKVVRAGPYSAQAQAGNVKLVAGAWNRAFIDEHAAFYTEGHPDDQVDAASGAYNRLAPYVHALEERERQRRTHGGEIPFRRR
ncbi:MAG: terminase family protein [Chloroflexi bacterium]|nr:terminase family protein [Chloroflexota bacterium]